MIYVIKTAVGVLLKTRSGRVIAYESADAAQEEIDVMESGRAARDLKPRGYQIAEYRESGE